jgi:hypothetical protein
MFFILPTIAQAQQNTLPPQEIAERQLVAYNNRDIEAFAALFAEDAVLYTLGVDKPIAQGKTEVYELYKRLFENSPNLYCKVVNRSILGNKVLDYEQVTGRAGTEDQVMEIIAIYEIEGDLIKRCYFVRK